MTIDEVLVRFRDEFRSWFTKRISKKLNIYQGTDKSGYAIIVNSDGDIVVDNLILNRIKTRNDVFTPSTFSIMI